MVRPAVSRQTEPPYADHTPLSAGNPIYLRACADYLQECLDNLKQKGIVLRMPDTNH
ncbi:hypothetical protein [Neisseria yangbaofengii]|uniref:hypothetical protein n=1 Tax=Neisseria yangbaofengii TaxID=2709396 RepID=UPI00280B7917|nr:hypothetical protein [Neisseria yangbaofengii]